MNSILKQTFFEVGGLAWFDECLHFVTLTAAARQLSMASKWSVGGGFLISIANVAVYIRQSNMFTHITSDHEPQGLDKYEYALDFL